MELTGMQVPESFARRGRPRGNAIVVAQRNQERFEEMVELIQDGKTQLEIGQLLGISQQRVSQVYRVALEFVPQPTIDQRRELQLLRLEQAIEKTLDVLEGDHPYVSEGRVVYPVESWENGKPVYAERPLQDVKPILDAARTLFAGLKREADTIGSDAPKRVETANLHVKADDLRVTKIIEGLVGVNGARKDEIASRVSSRRQLAAGASPAISGPGIADESAPVGSWKRRRKGFGADPRRVASWDPAGMVE
jgi:hypothetical protein